MIQRLLGIAAVVSVAVVGVTMVEAGALPTTEQEAPNAIKSRYMPTNIQTTLTTDGGGDYSYQWMYWANSTRREAISLPDSAYEHEAFTPAVGTQCWLGGYDPFQWGSNLPAAYLDTDFADPPSYRSRAGGSGVSISLSNGTWYYHWLRLTTACGINSDIYKIKSQDSIRQPPGCNADYANCVFPDTAAVDWLPYDAGLKIGSTYGFAYNQLANPRFEQDFAAWTRAGSGSVAIYGPGFEEAKFAEFNCGGGTPNCSIYTDKAFNVKTNGRFTFEVALRCAAGASCPVSVGLWGYGISANELAYRTITITGTGGWGRYGFVASGFQPHNLLRLQIYNGHLSNNLDVDFGTLHWSDNVSP